MSDLTHYPLQDGFKTSLSQSWTGGLGTVYVSNTPTFTFPSGVTTYIVVNPGKTNMQIAEINAYDGTAKTVTVSNITLEKGASINSTAQTHNVGSEVIISDNYQFWKDIASAINTKLNDDSDWIWDTATTFGGAVMKTLTTAQRTALTAVNGMVVYDTTAGELYQYLAGAWSAISAGSTQPNASTTVAGKIELATAAERAAGTSTGGTGALLVPTNDALVKTSSGAADENKIPVLNASGLVDAFVTPTDLTATQTNMTAGEALTAGNGLRMGVLSLAGETKTVTANYNGSIAGVRLGYDNTEYKLGESIVVATGGTVTGITVPLWKTGTPTGNITLKLYANQGGALLATSTNTVAESGLSATASSPTSSVFSFTSMILEPATYYLVMEVDRANSTTNYANWRPLNSGTAASYISNANAWVSTAFTHGYSIVFAALSENTTKVYKTSALTVNQNKFIGTANTSVSADATVVVNTAGVDDNQSGLTNGNVYLSNTTGTLSNTAGRIETYIGKAISSSKVSLFIKSPDSIYDVEVPINFYGSGATIYGGTASGASINMLGFGKITYTSSSVTSSLFQGVPSKVNADDDYNDDVDYSAISVLELEIDVAFKTGDTMRIGFAQTAITFYDAAQTGAKVLIEHLTTGALVKINSADGTTQSLGNTCPVVNYTKFNRYKLVHTVGTDAKLYINGLLMDTKVTNLPTAGNVFFGIGTNVSADEATFQNGKIKIKYT